MRDYRIGCDAHKRYSQLEVQDDRGQVVRQARVSHEPGAIQAFFAQYAKWGMSTRPTSSTPMAWQHFSGLGVYPPCGYRLLR